MADLEGGAHCALEPLSSLLGVLSLSHQQSCQGYLALNLNGWQLLPTRSQGNMTLDGLHVEIPYRPSSTDYRMCTAEVVL